MKYFLISIILFSLLFVLSSNHVLAQGGPPPPPAGLWIDKGAIILLIVGAIIGAKKVMDFQKSAKTKETPSETNN